MRILSTILNACFSFGKHSRIIRTDNLLPIKTKIDRIKSGALVAWDVDGTLIVPCDRLAFEPHYAFVHKLGAKICNEKGNEASQLWKNHFYHSLIFKYARQRVIDKDSIEIIRELQTRQIRTLALTALSRGSYGQIADVVTWRITQLHRMGFDFFPPLTENYCFQFKYLPYKKAMPAYRDGVLFSSNLPKGLILSEFCKRIKFVPTEVVFIDDREDHVTSVVSQMQQEGIPITAFLYQATKKMSLELDERIAEIQLRHLITNGKWLSEQDIK